jgi:hypothetical protein
MSDEESTHRNSWAVNIRSVELKSKKYRMVKVNSKQISVDRVV